MFPRLLPLLCAALTRTRPLLRLLPALLLAGGLAAGEALAQSAIKVLVNDEPVTTYDVKSRTQFLKLTSQGQASEAEALEELIDERLKLQEAKRRNVTVSEGEIDEAFAEIAARAKMSPDQLEQALGQAGVNPQTLKDRIRAEIAWSEIVRGRFRATVKITDRDVAAALGRSSGEADAGTALSEFKLQQIIFVVPAKAGGGYEAQRRQQAAAFRSRFAGCERAVEQAKGLRDVVVRPMVRREEGELSGEIGEEILATPVGKTTTPDRIEEGFQLIAVCDRTALPGQTKASDEARDALTAERGRLMARRYLRDLKSEAVIEYR
jgi:peptidyl-prolyl cis-trans isomerase SurA